MVEKNRVACYLFRVHLIVSKEKEEIRRVLGQLLKSVTAPLTSFSPENFSKETFFQEVETFPFLSQKKAVIVHDLDQLPEESIEAIGNYVERPNAWIELFLTAGELAPQSKLVKRMEKQGKVHRFKEEKPWDKEKRLAEWLIEEAKNEKVQLSIQAAMALVQGVDHQCLRMELDKLICFCYGRKEITVEDISQISTFVHHETLWQLGDALFALSSAKALSIGRVLLEEGMAIFLLLSSLKSQFMTGIELLSGGKVPYLKGNFLEKKMQMFKKYGKERLQQGILLIFETELKAKNSSADPAVLLEILTIRLTHDSVSPAQSVRAC